MYLPDIILRSLCNIIIGFLALLAIPLVWLLMQAIIIEDALRERIEEHEKDG